MTLKPLAWQERPSLIETLMPIQKLSIESYKEQMAGSGKTLTALGSYWKGRKPLILNRACILGCLLPSSDNPQKDLEIFELLMGMDKSSLKKRLQKNVSSKKQEEVLALLSQPYSEQVSAAKRPEEMDEDFQSDIWGKVNDHLGTSANNMQNLVEEMGIARFGHRPKVADVFCGSGQIPFEAARMGCDVYASDLNPIACMLTWGAFNIVGATEEKCKEIYRAQKELAEKVQNNIDELEVETDGNGWTAKVFLYCIEVRCPESGWLVPLIPSLIISQPRTGSKNNIVASLVPIPAQKRYSIEIIEWVNDLELPNYKNGTFQNGDVIHSPDGIKNYRVSLNTIRGDYKNGKENKNNLRMWSKLDFTPRPEDIFQERLYCVQWLKDKPFGRGTEYQFRAVTSEDQLREQKVIDYVKVNLAEWQEKGWVPDMVIEPGDKTDEPIRTRGWTHWHHLFNPRQLLIAGLLRKNMTNLNIVSFAQILNCSSRLAGWDPLSGGGGAARVTFYNQALNTLFAYACRPTKTIFNILEVDFFKFPLKVKTTVETRSAYDLQIENDIYITDPPYGDAVKYEEILEFFISWLRKNPPAEFANWTWDSRRSIAIKGEGEDFRQGMIASYRKMAEMMPDNGIQVLMFTHQSGSIWADMANIVWASGLRVTAAWYVVTEVESALKQGANVKGTVLLILRKRTKQSESFRDDLAWAIEAAVKEQVESMTGLDKAVRSHGAEGLYQDADLQMAGYAAALKVLTTYSIIDGKNMVTEAEAPRKPGEKSFVDQLIDFAVQTAVQFLVPSGFEKEEWQKLQPVERYFMKMLEVEAQGENSLDNYQNFAKAFKVKHFEDLMGVKKANSARLKLAIEFKNTMMTEATEMGSTQLRALLYAIYEIQKETEIEDVLLHLIDNCKTFMQSKHLLQKMATFIAQKRDAQKDTPTFKPKEEASAARVLAEALKNQRL